MAYTGRLSPKRVLFFFYFLDYNTSKYTQRNLPFWSVKGPKRGTRILSETRLRKTSCFSDLLLFAICTSPKIHTVPHFPPPHPRLPQKRVLENFQTLWEMCKCVPPPPPPPALGFSPICQIFFEVLQASPPVLNSPSLFKTEYLKKKQQLFNTFATQPFYLS